MEDSNGNKLTHARGDEEQRAANQRAAARARERIGPEELEHELTERLELRCTAVDHARFAEAARVRGLSESAFMRLAARELSLHPAIAQGALHGAWLELAQRGVETLGRIMAELADRSDLLRTKPVDVQLTLHGAAAAAATTKPAKKKHTAPRPKRGKGR